MWHFYCFPGRVITEIGYLFPKSGQLGASKRRRESGVAAFLFATVFWALSLPFLLPVIVGLGVLIVHGVGIAVRPGHSSDTAKPATQSINQGSFFSPAQRQNRPVAPTPDLPTTSAFSSDRAVSPTAGTASRPQVVFSPRHEIVQPVVTATGSAPKPAPRPSPTIASSDEPLSLRRFRAPHSRNRSAGEGGA